MIRHLFLLLLCAPAAWGAAVSVECGPLRLGFDESTGQWCELTCTESGQNLLGSSGQEDVWAAVQGDSWPNTGEWHAEPLRREKTQDGWRVHVTRRAGNWSVEAVFDVLPETGSIRRSAVLQWHGNEPIKVVATELRIPGITLGGSADAAWSLPGVYPPFERPLGDSVPGRTKREPGWTWSDTGVAYARTAQDQMALLTGYILELDGASVLAEEVAKGVSFAHRFHTQALLKPGEKLTIGTQWIRAAQGGEQAFHRAATEFAGQCNPGPPADRPAWLEGAVIEELHPWGRLESWHGGDRGNRMPSIEAQLPYLRGLGITGIWLLPISNKPPWVYSLPAFRHLDTDVTTADQLRSFIGTSHRLGMHTLMDVVTYGVRPDSPDVAKLPDTVWCLDEKGERITAWNGSVLSADCSDPQWRDHTVDLTSYWVREFGCDGFRLDCGGQGQTPNWRPRPNLRANAPRLAGGIGQNALIRKAIRDINPDAVLLPEAGGTCHLTVSDLIFDYPFYMVCREMTREPDMARWVAQARGWLAAQQLTHSHAQQMALLRFLENHDTVAAQDYWGVGPSQALTALCTFVPGALLLYQEQEIGFGPELRTWLQLRQRLPELKTGRADYESVAADDPRVLAFLRQTEGQASVVAVNFAPEEVACTLAWPQALADALPVCQNAETGQQVVRGEPVSIAPYRPVVITLRAKAQKPVAPERTAAKGVAFEVNRSEKAGAGKAVLHKIDVKNGARWFVSTGEGLLTDEFVDRHRSVREGQTHVDATIPLHRCWRPLTRGLWEGLTQASLGVCSANGKAVEVRVKDRAQLRDVRIEDPASDGKNVSIILKTKEGSADFEVIEHKDSARLLRRLRGTTVKPPCEGLSVDPLWIRMANAHYQASFARRHGGGIQTLSAGAGFPKMGRSNLYSDWGLYAKGRHISVDWETNPRLALKPREEGAAITFWGHLRQPAWNGVHAGHPASPATAYRIGYEVGPSSALRVSFGITPLKRRPAAKAFLAYSIPFSNVTGWEVNGIASPLRGVPGEAPSKRVFQFNGNTEDANKAIIALKGPGGRVEIRGFKGDPAPPQSVFLLDAGKGSMHLFVCLLNGEPTPLPAGEECRVAFDIQFSGD